MSLKLLEEMEKRAYNKVTNLWSATVALIRQRHLRWLSLLVTNADDSTKNRIARESFELTSFLMRRKKLSESIREQIRAVYTDFDPETHYATITNNGMKRVTTPIDITKVPKSLVYARHMWHITIVHDRMVDRWIESMELFADGLFELTGAALIQKMQEYTGRSNYAIDESIAESIIDEYSKVEDDDGGEGDGSG